jgi:hypothetical protein
MCHWFICGAGEFHMWSNERVLTVVEDLQSHACLWDVHCAEYKNRNKNGDAISLIAKKLKLIITEVEKNNANLKGQFWRQHKTVVASKKSGSSPKKPIWFAYEALLFLLQYNEQTDRRITLNEEENDVSALRTPAKV